ncbi:MAG TPA: rhomboid family intramembrane serine protease, partial [Solirubrobacterales bacterium]|nr:rhomboid family intramembrane serine protease [Solirubrobacterales bacterium]
MSETELSVICKNCGSEVSPYVTECPYCGTRIRKRAPKLERRGDALEAKQPRTRRRRMPRPGRPSFAVSEDRPYATIGIILASAILLLVQKATGYGLISFGDLVYPLEGDWWRYLTAPFAYIDLGYLFVVAIALAIFGTGLERRLGSMPTAILLIACGSLGMVAAWLAANVEDDLL